MEKLTVNAEKIMSFNQANIDVILKSSQIWSAGLQDISKNFAAVAKAQFDQTVSAWKALSSVKSPKEAMALQSTLISTSFEMAITESGKLTDASIKLAEKTIAPITAHMTHTVQTITQPAA